MRLKAHHTPRPYLPKHKLQQHRQRLKTSPCEPQWAGSGEFTQLASASVMQQTIYSKLTAQDVGHHLNPSLCLCGECNCGRHLCKMNTLKLDMRKKTHYQQTFKGARPSQQKSQLVYAKEYERLKGPHLGDMGSTYHGEYTGRSGDGVYRNRPQDQLKTEGPSPELTSYLAQFPGHRGGNQYVKPTDKHIRGRFPLRCKSTYSGQFITKPLKKDNYKYIEDQLKTGNNWFCPRQSSYSANFAQPNPEYFAKRVTVVEKQEQKPADRLRFKTTYGRQFMSKGRVMCPAKAALESRGKTSHGEHKTKYEENSDFKSMSDHFQSFSRCKHSLT